MKDLLPEHAELVADEKKWSSRKKDWYLHCTSYEQRLKYFRELIRRFSAVGAYTTSNPSVPVAWILEKTGVLSCVFSMVYSTFCSGASSISVDTLRFKNAFSTWQK